MTEEKYIRKRMHKAACQSLLFYLFRIFPLNRKKIVFTSIEGTTGYMCNPKYIAEELLKQKQGYTLVWLADDTSRRFPAGIKVVHNTLWNRSYQLTTAKIWIDNSRKQLEVRKRRKQVYIQTWHAKIGFKPTGLDRGRSFSRIAELVSKHDSDMIDYMLSNCDMFDQVAPTGLLYHGRMLRTGSPRLDRLVKRTESEIAEAKIRYGLKAEDKIAIWAPTFRSGSQETHRTINAGVTDLDFNKVIAAFHKKFGGDWHIFVRLHPQLAARKVSYEFLHPGVIDISGEDDLYDIMLGCEAVITDYSSVAFDAGTACIPVFLYCNDYDEYVAERGNLLWNIEQLPFPFARTNEQLYENIINFSVDKYRDKLTLLLRDINMVEDGRAAKRVVELIHKISREEEEQTD